MFVRIQNEQNPIQIKKSEIGKNFDIRASGTPANTNKSLQLQNLERIMQLALSPAVLNSGVFDVNELLRLWTRIIDISLADRVVRSPEDSNAVQTILQAAQLQAQEQGGVEPTGF